MKTAKIAASVLTEKGKTMKRDFSLKPRTTGDLPPEKLEQILGRIYPEETVAELMDKLCHADEERKDNEHT